MKMAPFYLFFQRISNDEMKNEQGNNVNTVKSARQYMPTLNKQLMRTYQDLYT